jgi:murein DD-endopeptidase MepM/ murein hydrolase activator NlpD
LLPRSSSRHPLRETTLTAALLVGLVLGGAAPPAAADHPELDAARLEAEAVAAEVAVARAHLATVEDEAEAVAARAGRIEARLDRMRDVVQAQAVERFVQGGEDHAGATDALLRGEGVDQAGRADVLARTVTARSDEVLRAYRAAREELAGVRRHLVEVRGMAAAAVAELDQRSLEAAAALEGQVVLEAERLEAARLEAVGAAGGTGFLCPVDGPRAFTNDWGQARSGGRRHQGTDVLSPRGTPVVASVAGTVEGHRSSLGGISYTLVGDDGTTYYGTHLDSLAGASGRVERGTVLGTVGNSGNARGGPAHLHFEIRPGGGPAVNPYPTLAEHC